MAENSFIINPSINVSPYCYSILRIEPYSSCAHGCVYCFGRWYRAVEADKDRFRVIRSFKGMLMSLRRRGLKTIPFRLSTLVDPFQPEERRLQLSRYVMLLCLEHDAPLIINTKSTLLLEGDYPNILEKLGSRGLALVQISLSTINSKTASILEPKAPPPDKRLEAAERISGKNIPVVVRLQPFIPGITDYEAEDIIRQSRYAGVRQIIVESLRDEVGNLRFYEGIAYDKTAYRSMDLWVTYSPSIEVSSRIVRPSIRWRFSAYMLIKGLCDKYGLEFSTCKEGFYNHHTAKNCCGMHLLDDSKYVLRPTLQEVWDYYKRYGRIPTFEELTSGLGEKYLFGDCAKRYPRLLRKGIKSHEKILREILDEQQDRVSTLTPAIHSITT